MNWARRGNLAIDESDVLSLRVDRGDDEDAERVTIGRMGDVDRGDVPAAERGDFDVLADIWGDAQGMGYRGSVLADYGAAKGI